MRKMLKTTQTCSDKPAITIQSGLPGPLHNPIFRCEPTWSSKSNSQVWLRKQPHVFREEKESHSQSKNHQMESQAQFHNWHLSPPPYCFTHLLLFWAGNPCPGWSAPSTERCPKPHCSDMFLKSMESSQHHCSELCRLQTEQLSAIIHRVCNANNAPLRLFSAPPEHMYTAVLRFLLSKQ